MLNPPKSRPEAEKYRYGAFRGLSGWPYAFDRCAMEVFTKFHFCPAQCTRKPVAGPDNLYCKQHAKKVEER